METILTQFLESKYVGAGEKATFEILKKLTHLQEKENRNFPENGIYRQLPLKSVISKEDYDMLSSEHQKGSIDIFLVLNQKRIAVRIQGRGHGQGDKIHGRYTLKGSGKPKHDSVQASLIRKYNSLVDIDVVNECKILYKDIVNDSSQKELIDSFNTANVGIPVL